MLNRMMIRGDAHIDITDYTIRAASVKRVV